MKKIEVSGLPEGAVVEYESNQSIAVGVYNATAFIKKEGYKTLTLAATLTITPANFTGVILKDKEYIYDGSEKILEAENLPSDAKIDYISNKATIPGTYQVKVTITKANYNDLVLNATLTIIPAKIIGVVFKDKEYNYDSNEKFLEVENLPTAATVQYTSNKAINAGIYQATATITKPYHNDLILTATLTINKIEITNLEFNNKTVEYDEQIHKIEIVGNLPAGVIVKYYYNDLEVEGVNAVGEYQVKAVILESQNYLGLVLTSVLKITSTEEQLYSVRVGNKIYFQNNLDNNYLYLYENNNITKVNNHMPEYMMTNNTNIYYYNKSLFSKDIMVYNGSEANSLASTKGEYLTTDGTYIYYAINNLIFNTNVNGIYKLKMDGSTDPIRITADKASFLTYQGGFIYYANNSKNKYLYKISTNMVEGTGTLLWEEKVEYITLGNNNSLYFSSSKQILGIDVATAIYKYMINSDSFVKLTTDAGKYLTVINDDLYYINHDKITSFIFGRGIYKVNTLSTSDNNLPGIKVLEAPEGDGYSSLSSDGANLYYYKLSDKHFYSYSIKDGSEIDLMKNYQPSNEILLVGHVSIAEYKGEIYYINSLETDFLGVTGGTLYKYNPVTKMNVKVFTDNVSNVYFYENYMYYSTFMTTNYALFRMDMVTGEVIKIINTRTDNLIFEDGLIYYIKVGSLYNNYIYQMELDGSNPTLIQDSDNLWVKELVKDGNTFYYARNPKIFSENISSYTIGDKKPVDYGIKARIVLLNNNLLYYYNHNNSTIGSVLLDATGQKTLISNVEVNNMLINDNILYYSSTDPAHYGLYAYNLETNSEIKISDFVGDALTFVGDRLYFMQTAVSFTNDYPYHQAENVDGRLYYYDGVKVVKAT